ncbi:2-keto-4-pentenoate hydratase/2-oxohepta-3-ene-1,7-dioic acid hydratase in catechol pathway [Tumebacillus sp. BK434]|uniref:fumarylacetoacetate hydrolase family protein n=1 Tax=Tumebacillus sp. BK434 TaxID=2512169 RepID=UPI00104BF661|nr:fumarylacetoacetate hydrolase family protein [Tumebacillus sp. BK434]TCP59162.1 2-keto-4-pentenoate hydratase/2-oxohepta-3-ene-1,7-dioic acid hydratase in catechol pathway [Tumebacillus sp. BK434]
MEDIRNIYCVGRNYRLHAAELGNEVPKSPFLFSKPTHAQVAADGGEIVLPAGQGEIHHELELVVQVSRPFEPGMKVDDAVGSFALGLDLTLRDVQSELKQKGHPWLRAKGFKNSAVLTASRPFPGVEAALQTEFYMLKNGVEVQRGNIGDMVFDLQALFDFTAEHFGLSTGDILFTGTPAGVGPLADGDLLELFWGGERLGSCAIRLR